MTTKVAERSIHERMVAVLADLPAIGKDQVNQQQHFKFRGIDDVLNALNPLLAKHGVFYVPEVIERIDSERTTTKGSTMFVVNLHVRYTFYGAGGDSVSATAWGEGTDMGDKATPKAMTGAMKACLFQAFAISTEEVTDPDAATPEESKSAGKVPAAAEAPEGGAPGKDAPPPVASVTEDAMSQLRKDWYAAGKGSTLTDNELMRYVEATYGEGKGTKDLTPKQLEEDIAKFRGLKGAAIAKLKLELKPAEALA